MSKDPRVPIGYVEALVCFPLYDGDDIKSSNSFDWFEYHQPSVTNSGKLGECSRLVKVLKVEIKLVEETKNEHMRTL